MWACSLIHFLFIVTLHRNLQNRSNLAWLCILRIQLPQILLESYYRNHRIICSSEKKQTNKWIIISGRFEPSLFFFLWPSLVARNGQDVTRAALGEVWLRLVDLGLHNDGALPPVHAALDGTRDVDLQLPLLAAERQEKMEKKLLDIGRSTFAHQTFTAMIKVYSNTSSYCDSNIPAAACLNGFTLHSVMV